MKKVLIADDLEYVHFMYKQALASYPEIRVISAKDGYDALQLFKIEKPDLVILDINLPYKNGVEVLKEIRKVNQTVPVIMCTAYNTADYVRNCAYLGITAYLVKPVDLKEFKSKVLEILNISQSKDFVNLMLLKNTLKEKGLLVFDELVKLNEEDYLKMKVKEILDDLEELEKFYIKEKIIERAKLKDNATYKKFKMFLQKKKENILMLIDKLSKFPEKQKTIKVLNKMVDEIDRLLAI